MRQRPGLIGLILLGIIFALAQPAAAERPRPLGWAIDAMRNGNFNAALRIAGRDGPVARDVIEWHRLRAGRGTFQDVTEFLKRRADWPGEAYLRRRSEPAVLKAGDAAILSFFKGAPPQTPRGILGHAAAQARAGNTSAAQASIVAAWRSLPMDATEQALFLAQHEALLKPHHAARLDEMLWRRQHTDARQMFELVDDDARNLAQTRIALQTRSDDASARVRALSEVLQRDAGLSHDRFEWRLRAGLEDDAKALLMERSVSVASLGQPAAWGSRRRAWARDEMRQGDPTRAYQIASQHFLTEGSDFADLEWLSGYLALRFLRDPARALAHFQAHESAVQSPISQGRAGYWQGRALEAMGNTEAADKAYSEGAKYQTSFYGLLAAERAGLPFDTSLAGRAPLLSWRSSALAKAPLFEAGMLLQASGEVTLAEWFWTHLADQLLTDDLELLGQAAIDMGRPHLAVMVGKRAARRGLTIPAPYYPLHAAAKMDLPMSPEMTLAIARRESEFDPRVQSHAGARGLMQLMPTTARDVARDLDISALHTTDRLTADPEYNARLGATYLSQMAGRFEGNVVMMSAAYNAGPSRPARWMTLFGDPREGDIDVVDWIEMIPFRETQNYVMRVTESLPVYRARLGLDPLPVPFSEELIASTLLSFAPESE